MRIAHSLGDVLEVLRGLPTPLYATDLEGRLLLWNRAMTDLTGQVAPERSLPASTLRLVQDFAPLVGDNPLLDAVLKSGQPVSMVDAGLSFETEAGERAVDFFGEPLVDSEGAVQGALAVLCDRTRQRALEKTLDGFERTAGHDLRNAVGVLEGYLPLLMTEDGRMPDGGPAMLQTLQRTSHLLQSIINLMLTNARFVRRLAPGAPEPLLLREVFMQAWRAVEPTAANKDVSMDSQVPSEMLILGHNETLQAAVVNMLFAATKLSRNRAAVEVRAAVLGSEADVEVTFRGKPIEPVELERMFSTLGQPQDPRLGIGVSLCLARSLLRASGSDLGMQARSDDANVLVFRLPLR